MEVWEPKMMDTQNLDVRLEVFPTREVIFYRQIGPYPQKAPAAWNCLWEWIFEKNLASQVNWTCGYGLDSPRLIPADMLRYYACIELKGGFPPSLLSELPEAMGVQRIEGGRFAIYQMKGDYKAMPDYFCKLHDEWLPSSGMIPDYSRPFLEIYLNNPAEVGLENALTDLCLPIR